jgi:hypothetical protein
MINHRTEGRRLDLPFFSLVLGFVVNHDPCRAIQFDPRVSAPLWFYITSSEFLRAMTWGLTGVPVDQSHELRTLMFKLVDVSRDKLSGIVSDTDCPETLSRHYAIVDVPSPCFRFATAGGNQRLP